MEDGIKSGGKREKDSISIMKLIHVLYKPFDRIYYSIYSIYSILLNFNGLGTCLDGIKDGIGIMCEVCGLECD
jgi:hypothetical protein